MAVRCTKRRRMTDQNVSPNPKLAMDLSPKGSLSGSFSTVDPDGCVSPLSFASAVRDECDWIEQFPLSTRGRHVINKRGQRFRFCGVNWYGASDCNHVVGGLDTQKLDVICESVRSLGFTVVRLPFSNQMLRSDVPDGSIDYAVNPELKGLSALEVLDEAILCLGKHKVAVILNNHTTYGEWCGPPSKNSLWFDAGSPYTEERWLEDWVFMAHRYRYCAHVVGFDLRNEIRPRGFHWPNWSGRSLCCRRRAQTCCWARAAKEAAKRLLEVCPDGLIIVERIVWPQKEVRQYLESPGPLLPELAGRLVIGVHHYSWSGPGRFLPRWAVPPRLKWVDWLLRMTRIISPHNYGDMTASRLEKQLRQEWGCVLEANLCPVWVSEFGTDQSEGELKWLADFVAVLAKLDADWAYWPLNVGPKPSCGGDEAYGLLAKDWTLKRDKDSRLDLLARIGLAPSLPSLRDAPGGGDVLSPTADSDHELVEIPLLPGHVPSTATLT